MPKILTTPLFWDCNCETNYIHSSTEYHCALCGAINNDEQPDSRIDEVLLIPAFAEILANSVLNLEAP